MTGNEHWRTRWQGALMDNYGTPTLTLVRGKGSHVWDADGREYLDLVGGIAVNVLGHAHPAMVDAVSRQVATLGHTSNLVINPVTVELAERLLHLFGRPGRVFFCNSGAEATETALKISRLTGRAGVVAAERSFHGRTMGALGVTGQPAKREAFLPLFGEVSFVPYGDVPALQSAVTSSTAAVLLEPIQGEGGIHAAPPGYLAAAQEAAHSAGALSVLDEVQTGIGRTGAWFAHQPLGLEPDLVTLAKGLGGGLPIGACVAFGEAADLLRPGQHGSTFGGNPIAAAAALAVLDTIEHDGLLDRATSVGAQLVAGIEGLRDPLISGVRGVGLLLGVVLTEPVAAHLEVLLREQGVLVNAISPTVIRLAPALVLTDEDVSAFLATLAHVLSAGPVAGDAS